MYDRMGEEQLYRPDLRSAESHFSKIATSGRSTPPHPFALTCSGVGP